MILQPICSGNRCQLQAFCPNLNRSSVDSSGRWIDVGLSIPYLSSLLDLPNGFLVGIPFY